MSRQRRRRSSELALTIFASIVFLVLAAPIAVVIAVSVGEEFVVDFPPSGFTLDWYREMASPTEPWRDAFVLSTIVAVVSTVVATSIGILLATALTRANLPLKSLVMALVLAPLVVPHVVTALALYFMASTLGMNGTTVALVIGHACLSLPLAVLILTATLKGIDPRLDQAAAVMGASRLTTLRLVVIPLAAPGVIAASIFAFLTSFDEFFIALFLVDPADQTLPIAIFESLQFAITPTTTAVSAVVILLAVFGLAASQAVRSISNRKLKGEDEAPAPETLADQVLSTK